MPVVRNTACIPDLLKEGHFTHPICIKADPQDHLHWKEGLSFGDRLFSHHTLCSLRKHEFFRPNLHLVPQDELDFILASAYNHSKYLFDDRNDIYMQRETRGLPTWRRLKNTRDLKPPLDYRLENQICHKYKRSLTQKLKRGVVVSEDLPRYNPHHVVMIGGEVERIHPFYPKLMNSSHHAPQTNAGYTRKEGDGSTFYY